MRWPGTAASTIVTGESETAARGAVLVENTGMLEDTRRIAAAVGCELAVPGDVEHLRPAWSEAAVIVIDEDAARRCLAAGLPRRGGVLLLATQPPSPEALHLAVQVGVEQVLVLPESEDDLAERLADAAETPAATRGAALGVLGARGGAGASTFAVAVSCAAARAGRRALLVDCDPHGGGVDLLLGLERQAGVRWPQLAISRGRLAASALHEGLPRTSVGAGSVNVLSCDRAESADDDGAPHTGMTVEAVRAVVRAGLRSGDTVVCDFSRTGNGPGWSVLDHLDLATLVVPADVRGCVAGRARAAALREHGVTTHAVVRGPAPGGLRDRDVSQAVGVRTCTAMRPQSGLSRVTERGALGKLKRGPLPTAANEVLATLRTASTARETA